jgi:hypothetical protein
MRSTLVIAALTLGIAAPALAQVKEGTFSGTYSRLRHVQGHPHREGAGPLHFR